MNRLLILAVLPLIMVCVVNATRGNEVTDLDVQDETDAEELTDYITENLAEPKQKTRRLRKKTKKSRKKNKTSRKKNSKNSKKTTKVKKSKKLARKQGTRTCDCDAKYIANIYKHYHMAFNFQKQTKRAKIHASKTSKKEQKNNTFDSVYIHLLDAGGNNPSNLTCAGQTNGTGVDNLRTILNNTKNCKETIRLKCGPGFRKTLIPKEPNSTALDECYATKKSYTSTLRTCEKKNTAAEACDCYKTVEHKMDAVKSCTAKDSATNMTYSEYQQRVTWVKGNCTDAFSVCRGVEDSAVGVISACRTTTGNLLAKAKALTANLKSASNVANKTNAALTAASSGRQRTERTVATTCAGFVSQVAAFSALPHTTDSATVAAMETDIMAYDTSITCSADDLKNLQTQSTAMTAKVAELTASVAVAQTQLQGLTGSTASASAIDEATAVTPSYRLRRAQLLEQMRRSLV